MFTWEKVHTDWKSVLETFFTSPVGFSLQHFLHDRHQKGAVIFPNNPFYALELTSLKETRVVIVGQDPYHGQGQAQGLAFHVPAGIRIPPSLRNIHKELQRDLGIAPSNTGELTGWAKQGVLLLNTVLTVEEGKPASHAKKGWEVLTDRLLIEVARDKQPKVFLLWGNHAQSKVPLIEHCGHLILQANHPSPLSANRPPIPFIGCGHFSLANDWLAQHGRSRIKWEKFY